MDGRHVLPFRSKPRPTANQTNDTLVRTKQGEMVCADERGEKKTRLDTVQESLAGTALAGTSVNCGFVRVDVAPGQWLSSAQCWAALAWV